VDNSNSFNDTFAFNISKGFDRRSTFFDAFAAKLNNWLLRQPFLLIVFRQNQNQGKISTEYLGKTHYLGKADVQPQIEQLNASNPREIIEDAINHPVLKKSHYILLPLSAILRAASPPTLIFEKSSPVPKIVREQ